MPRLTFAPLAVLLAIAGPAAARAPADSVPAMAAKVPFERFTLPNGLTVLVYTDYSVPSVFVGTWYRIGSKDEPAGKAGFAHLFEHLMFQSTAHRAGEYLAPLERAGAIDINGSTTSDYTNYQETVPTNALDLALWMESDRMGYLAGGITQAELDAQRNVVLNEKRQGELAPQDAARRRFLAGFYPPDHPYAHDPIGSSADLAAATLADVKQWFTDYYGASNAVLVLAGDVDAATARDKVTRYFGAIRQGKAVSRPLQWTPPLPEIRRELVRGPFPAAMLTRSWSIANDDPRALTLLQLGAKAMAGRNDAPLIRALVDGGIASDVSASLTDSMLSSVLSVSMTLRPGVTPDTARAALDDALRGYAAAGPEPARLGAIVAASDTAILRSLESNAAIGQWLIGGEVEHDDPAYFLKQRDWIARTTPAEVRAAIAPALARAYHEMLLLPEPLPAPAMADVDRSRPPEPGAFRGAIAFPPITAMTLPNGLKLVVAQRPRGAMIDMAMHVAAGSAADRGYAPGAAAAAFALMTQGAGKRDATAVTQEAARLGVDLSVAPGLRSSRLDWSAPRDRLDAAFALAAEVLRRPTYPSPAVERVGAARAERFDGYARAPMDAAGALLGRAIWGDTDPRGRIAGRDAGPPLSRDAVVRFHDQQIVPNTATLYMIGDIAPDRARALAVKYFGDWAAVTSLPARPPVAAPASGPRIILVDAPGVEQTSVTVGAIAAPFDSDVAAAETLAVAALGDGFSGRLNRNLRGDKGWTYGFGGGVSDEAEGTRLFSASGTIQADRTAASIAEIHRELSGFVAARPLSAAELEDQRSAAIRSIPAGFDGNGAFLNAMMSAAARGLPHDRAAGAADRLGAVTLDAARGAARRLYDPAALTFVVIGDLKAIEAPVRALGLAPVEVWDVSGRRLR